MRNICSPNRASSLPQFWAKRDPDRFAALSGDGICTYSELAERIQRTGSVLRDLGLRSGDRLLIVAENCLTTVIILFAAMELGVVPAILNARLSRQELTNFERSVKPKRIIFVTSGSLDTLNHANVYDCQALAGNNPEACLISTALLSEVESASTTTENNDIACLVLTSGTTGAPKCVVLGHRALVHMGRISSYAETEQPATYYVVSPLAHILGLGSNLIPAVCTGACLELVARFDARTMLDAICTGQITHLVCVPAVYAALLRTAKADGFSNVPNRLQAMRAGGAPLTMELKNEIQDLFGLPLDNGYGMTECNSISRTHGGKSPEDSVGVANEDVQIRILDLHGAPVPQGKVGRLTVKSPCLASGLWTNGQIQPLPEMLDGWLETGDLARLDVDNNIYVVGRSKEVIIRSGFNVMPGEVEAAICGHEWIASCAVIGHPVEHGDTRIVAFVVCVPGADISEEQLKSYCRLQLAGYKCPSRFVVTDEFPLLSNGKVDKKSLQQMASEAA